MKAVILVSHLVFIRDDFSFGFKILYFACAALYFFRLFLSFHFVFLVNDLVFAY